MTRHLLIPAALCATLLPCPAQQENAAPAQMSPVSLPVLPAAMEDALAIYQELRLLMQESSMTAGKVQLATERIRPHCFTLGLLAPAAREKIIMLADAVLWQEQWMDAVYAQECGLEYEAPFLDEGFETLILLSNKCSRLLADSSTPPALRQAIQELVDTLGGPSALKLPGSLIHKRWAKDYKTALNFFKALCAAASEENEAACLAALQEQMPTLHYFQQGGEWEQLRLNALAQRFRLTLTSIGSNQHPFGSTVLPESRRTPARMRALAPFIDSLWALEPLLLQPLEYESK